jgi:enoyl-[acyl-carrier protein] reductase II
MGTRFIGTKEADTCFGDIWKKRLLKTDDRSTIVARGFVGPLRYLRNEASVQLARLTVEKVPNLFAGQPDITLDQTLLATELEGHMDLAGEDDERALFYGGEVAGRIQDIPSVKEFVERIAEEAEDIIKELPGKVIV